MKILITGICGFLGLKLTRILSKHDLIGIDFKEPVKEFPDNVIFYKKNILEESILEIFRTHKLDVCVHLAWIVTPVHTNKLKNAYEIDYTGTTRILQYCKLSNIDHVIFMSSTLAYGALKENNHILTENDPLKAKNNFHYAYHKRLVETEIVHPFIKENPEIKVTILRPTAFLSQDANNYVSNILKAKILPVMIGGRNTRIQFMHIQDLLDVVRQIIEKRIDGIYNVAPDDYIIMKNLPKLLPGYKIYIPESIARLFMKIAWFLHIYNAPSSYLDFVRYEFLASNEKLKQKLGWRPRFSTDEAIKSVLTKN